MKKKKKGGRGCGLALLAMLVLATPVLAEDYENPVGIGADITVFELPNHKLQPEINLENRWDFNNREYTFMAVTKLNFFNWLQNDSD